MNQSMDAFISHYIQVKQHKKVGRELRTSSRSTEVFSTKSARSLNKRTARNRRQATCARTPRKHKGNSQSFFKRMNFSNRKINEEKCQHDLSWICIEWCGNALCFLGCGMRTDKAQSDVYLHDKRRQTRRMNASYSLPATEQFVPTGFEGIPYRQIVEWLLISPNYATKQISY